MKEALLASAAWYFDGPGWIINTCIVGPAIGAMIADKRSKFWVFTGLFVVLIMPFSLTALLYI